MKKKFYYIRSLFSAFIIITVVNSHAQQQFTHVASKSNNSCNGDCTILDVARLNNNPNAIIWATPVIEKGLNPNPHPIGAYYFQNQWRIMNLDQRPIPADTKFKIEYVTNPDENHFQYFITAENVQKDGSAIVDHPALNNIPTVQFHSFLSWNPEVNRATTNRDSIVMQFNPAIGKWLISNTNKKPLFARVSYNIIISSRGAPNAPVTNNAVQINELITPTPTPTTTNTTTTWGPASIMLMTVWADGIKLPGDSIRTGYLDRSELFGFEMGSSTLSSSGQLSVSGKKVYDPVTLKTHTGYSITVPLFNAFVKSQDIVILIEVFADGRSKGSRTPAPVYNIKLSGAHIAGFKQSYMKEGGNTDILQSNNSNSVIKYYYDEIKVIFTKIEVLKGIMSVVDNL